MNYRTVSDGEGCPVRERVYADPDAAGELERQEREYDARPKPQPKDDNHVCTPETCPEPGAYYVSAVDGPRWWKMAGPYSTHTDALQNVDRALTIANRYDGRAWYMAWGTVRMKDGDTEPGNLNKHKLI